MRAVRLAAGVMAILAASGTACSGQDAGGAPSAPTATAVASDHARTNMKLRIRLRDGFRNQAITITLDGKTIYRKSGVTTDLSISYADAVEAEVGAAHAVRLAVAVDGGPAAEDDIDANATPFVDVSIVDGRLRLQALASETPLL